MYPTTFIKTTLRNITLLQNITLAIKVGHPQSPMVKHLEGYLTWQKFLSFTFSNNSCSKLLLKSRHKNNALVIYNII